MVGPAKWWTRLTKTVQDRLRLLLTRSTLGDRGERAAARFLRRRGFRIVARGVRLPLGEIDIVALDRETLVFVEVKTRRSADHGQPWQAVDHRKRRKLTQLAVAYLKRYGITDRAARFDIVSIVWPEKKRRPEIKHYPNAFETTGPWR